MNELLELKHRIDNCTDDLQSFELRKIYDKLLINLWESGQISYLKCSLCLYLSSSEELNMTEIEN